TNPMITGPGGFLSTDAVSLLATAGTYQIQATDEEDCSLTAELELSVTSQAFVAGMVLPSDVVVGDSVVVLETSWPAPDNVSWVFDRAGAREVRRSENQYWFIFDEVGDYELSLLAGFGGCEDLITKGLTVHADSTSIPSVPLQRSRIESVIIRPNPSNGQFAVDIELSENAEVFVNLYDANGGIVERRQDDGASSYSVDFNLSSPPAGTYVLLVQTAFGRRTGIVLIE
ncbi:MAG: T9SS type A sorting domain-containing protein, partial [Bacteroidota bacterium]